MRQRPARRQRVFFRLGFALPTAFGFVAALRRARCWFCMAVAAALVHQPAARFIQLSHTLLGVPFIPRLLHSWGDPRR